jgi:hypothetical protein
VEVPKGHPSQLAFLFEHFVLAWTDLAAQGLNRIPLDRAPSGLACHPTPVAQDVQVRPTLQVKSYDREPSVAPSTWFMSIWNRARIATVYLAGEAHSRACRKKWGHFRLPTGPDLLDLFRPWCPVGATWGQLEAILRKKTWRRVTYGFPDIEEDETGPSPVRPADTKSECKLDMLARVTHVLTATLAPYWPENAAPHAPKEARKTRQEVEERVASGSFGMAQLQKRLGLKK